LYQGRDVNPFLLVDPDPDTLILLSAKGGQRIVHALARSLLSGLHYWI